LAQSVIEFNPPVRLTQHEPFCLAPLSETLLRSSSGKSFYPLGKQFDFKAVKTGPYFLL